MRKTAFVSRTEEVHDELALMQSERVWTQWTNELRQNIRDCPTCNILKAIFSLDLNTQTVVYVFLIKGWSASRIAAHFDVSLITVQELLTNGLEQLKVTLIQSHYLAGVA